MTSTIASSSIPHHLPPAFTLPSVPRIRPPRILLGTPSSNTNPQPAGPTPRGKIWVQGEWRDPKSNAAKDRRRVQSRRVEKALRHGIHGANIYAYCHIRTKQVVYSLTRVLQNNKILDQLIYHGKKTVPAALRRDMWTPYFSIHFPPTTAGTQSGLLAYQQLRELSTQRQLAPPPEMVMTTQADIDRARSKYDPVDLEELTRTKKLKLPIRGQLLPQELRAKKVMDQKASSVADVAFVLGLRQQGLSPSEVQRQREEAAATRGEGRSSRFRKRLRVLQEQREQLDTRWKKRAELVKIIGGNKGQLTLTADVATRIGMEFGGLVMSDGQVGKMQEMIRAEQYRKDLENHEESMQSNKEIKPSEKSVEEILQEADRSERLIEREGRNGTVSLTETSNSLTGAQEPESTEIEDKRAQQDEQSRQVVMLWADFRDGTYSESWPENVLHYQLARKAIAMGTSRDRGSNNGGLEPVSQSVHVIGGMQQLPKGIRHLLPHELEERRATRRNPKVEAWTEGERRKNQEMLDKVAAEVIPLRMEIDHAVIQRAEELWKDLPAAEAGEEHVEAAKREQIGLRGADQLTAVIQKTTSKLKSWQVGLADLGDTEDPNVSDVHEEIALLRVRTQSYDTLHAEAETERDLMHVPGSKGRIVPLLKFQELRIAVKSFEESQRAKAARGPQPSSVSRDFELARVRGGFTRMGMDHPEMRDMFDEIDTIENDKVARSREIEQLTIEKKMTRSSEERADLRHRLETLRGLIVEDEHAMKELYANALFSGRRRRREEADVARLRQQQVKKDLKAADAGRKPRVGLLTRVGRGILRRIPFVGRRDYSTASRTLRPARAAETPVKGSSARVPKEELPEEARAVLQLRKLHSQIRTAQTLVDGEEPATNVSALEEQAAVLESRFPLAKEINDKLTEMHRLNNEDAIEIPRMWRAIMQLEGVEDQEGKKLVLVNEIQRLKGDIRRRRKSMAVTYAQVGSKSDGENVRVDT